MPKRSLFQIHQKATEATVNSSTKEEVAGAVKETVKDNSSDYIKKNDKDKTEKVEDDLFIDDTDDWSTVPAFLRRNKK
jgi:hypothetical protein